MVEKFHKELKEVKKDVEKMGYLSKEMLQKSVKALKNRDIELAKWVILQKAKLADFDDNIEKKTFRLIALYQPMAKDMREIACILKMITYIARIGRYGKDIARITEELRSKPHVKKLVSLPHMSDIVCSMIDDALKTFDDGGLTRFNNFIDRENDVDELRYSIFRECLSYMMEDPKVIRRCTDYVMVARYLERCGDHACKMAEKITYMITGERVEIDCREETSKACFTGVKKDE
jgi:phosphate transport system protein